MRWAVLMATTTVGCTTIDVIYDGDASTDASIADDATTDACFAFNCYDVIAFDGALPPPPVACPAWQPLEGSACSVPDYEDCEYGPYDYFCNVHFRCGSGKWVKVPYLGGPGCGFADACSTITDGGVCHARGQVCPSGDGGVCVCSGCGVGPPPAPFSDGSLPPAGAWICYALDEGCSQDRPNLGTSCDLADGGTCSYSPGGCCVGVVETCASGVWLGTETEPCP